MHEASLHADNSFITLTYAPEHLPQDSSLCYDHFQRFMKRLRKRVRLPVRFYMCGEYGENFGRIFGYGFPDKKPLMRTKNGDILFTSEMLSQLWPYGLSSIGEVNFQSAAYVARYIMKKITGDAAYDHYNKVDEDGVVTSRTPEFTRMSLKPGIGAGWFDKYHSDVFPHDHVIVKGKEVSVPRYYTDKVRRSSFGALPPTKVRAELDEYDIDEIQYARLLRVRERAESDTPERRVARDEINRAKLNLLKRTIV
jgi:predicted nucleic acid-binding Zn ribbon protein